jgi:hypothetical protein
MKHIVILAFSTLLFFTSCAIENIDAESNKIDGKWELYKITIGFPYPGGPTELLPEKNIRMEINSIKNTIVIFENNQKTETSSFSLKTFAESANDRLALYFWDSDSYSFYTYDEAKDNIILYERTPIGAEIADGNSYHYRRLKQ